MRLHSAGPSLRHDFYSKIYLRNMTTFTLNPLTGAVSHYSGFAFHGITPTHAGNTHGLFALGGDTDADLPIVAVVQTPITLQESTLKKVLEVAYLAMRGTGKAEMRVMGLAAQWAYPFEVLPAGVSKCKLGRGIHENYLGFGFSNPGGEDFQIDRLEIAMSGSKNRRSA